jgi:fructokinase
MSDQPDSKETRPVIVGLGEVLWDLLPGGKQLGGAPANFAYHAAALGAEAAVVSRVGGDELGRAALDRLAAVGLDRRYVSIDPDDPTGTVEVRLGPGGVPDYVIHTGVAWDFLTFTPDLADLAGRADAVCYGTLAQRGPVSRRGVRQFLDAVRPQCLRVFDVNLRQSFFDLSLVHDTLMKSDVLKLNEAEVPAVAHLLGVRGEGAEAVQNLMSRYPLRLVAVTRGPYGARLQGIGEASVHRGFPVSDLPAGADNALAAPDTVGAGDAFTAALVTGLLRGRPLRDINAFANRLARYVCTKPGAMPPIPAELRKGL